MTDPLNLAFIALAIGVLFLFAEWLFPAGFVLAGLGAILALGGVGAMFIYGSTETAMTALLSLCVGGPLLAGLLFMLWPYSPLGRTRLRAGDNEVTAANSGANSELEALRGTVGKAVSLLRPSGVAEFGGRRVDVLTEGMVVEAGQWVKCIDIRAGKVIVQPTDSPTLKELENADFS